MADDDDVKYTLFVLGPGAVGKTSLTIRFLSDTFSSEYEPTIEDFYRKTIDVDNVQSVLEIYDTAGQEEFSTMRDSYYRTGDGFLLVYNITSQLSYNDVQNTYDRLLTARRAGDDDIPPPPILLAGNKCDLTEHRQVSQVDGKKLGMSLVSIYSQNRIICDKQLKNGIAPSLKPPRRTESISIPFLRNLFVKLNGNQTQDHKKKPTPIHTTIVEVDVVSFCKLIQSFAM
eukprot:61902_1